MTIIRTETCSILYTKYRLTVNLWLFVAVLYLSNGSGAVSHSHHTRNVCTNGVRWTINSTFINRTNYEPVGRVAQSV